MKLPENVLEYFRKQGKIGATKRAATLSPERRREIASLAAQARWKKAKESPKKSSAKKSLKIRRRDHAQRRPLRQSFQP
jgi:hypothetical protein